MIKKGFTLVELSISLTIIGLLVAGILVGKNLIRNAQINKTIQLIGQFDSAVIAYKNQFRYLPGDNPNEMPLYTGSIGKGCFGDGTIDTGCNAFDLFDTRKAGTHFFGGQWQFWHIISGRKYLPNPATNSSFAHGPDFLSSGKYQTTVAAPIAKSGNDVGFWVSCGMWTTGGMNHHNCENQPSNPRPIENFYSIVQGYRPADGGGQWAGPKGFASTLPGFEGDGRTVRPADALALDQKMDDGFANSGHVLSGGTSSQVGAPSKWILNPDCNEFAKYKVADDGHKCLPLIRVGSQIGGL